MICDRNLEIFVCVVNTVVFSLLTVLHLSATYLVYISRKIFHPCFVMFFFPFIFLYMICDILPVVYDVGKRVGLPDDHGFQVLVSNLLIISYRTITPIVIAFLMERLYATVNCGTYEGSRPRIFPWLLPLGAFLATLDDLLLYYGAITSRTENWTMLIVEIFIIILLCVLYLVNRRLVVRNTGTGVRLSARYQLSENVRVLRLVITVVVLDGFVTISNILGDLLFGVASSFDLVACAQQSSYFSMYITINVISLSISASITVAIVYGHPAIRRNASRHFCCVRKEIRITNVLGEDLRQSASTADYFTQLYNQWN